MLFELGDTGKQKPACKGKSVSPDFPPVSACVRRKLQTARERKEQNLEAACWGWEKEGGGGGTEALAKWN